MGQQHDALVALKSAFESVQPTAGYSYDLTGTDRVQLGRYVGSAASPPSPLRPPAGSPFVFLTLLEEGLWERRGRDVMRRADYLVSGWVRGSDLPGGGTDSVGDRLLAASLLYDDLVRAALVHRRLGGVAEDIIVQGSTFLADIIDPTNKFAVCVLIVRVGLGWYSP